MDLKADDMINALVISKYPLSTNTFCLCAPTVLTSMLLAYRGFRGEGSENFTPRTGEQTLKWFKDQVIISCLCRAVLVKTFSPRTDTMVAFQ